MPWMWFGITTKPSSVTSVNLFSSERQTPATISPAGFSLTLSSDGSPSRQHLSCTTIVTKHVHVLA